ncbi:MAG: hypothetical protein NTX79_06605 [Candidatus Micrarchaeota archaeon]|nr:hypothetical protein [Candidatus Micrarchaeota archaeon]
MAFDWKEFLTPSWKKAAVAALLFILFVPFINYWNGIMCIRAPCPSSSAGSMLLFALSGPRHIYSLDLPIALAGIAVCYAIACALVSFLAKRRGKAVKGK